MRFTPNGKYVLAWSLDSCIRLWDYNEGRCVKTYQGHTNRKFSICGAFGTYGDGGKEWAFAVSGSEDGAVLLWDVSDKHVLQRLEGHEGVVLGVDSMVGGSKGLIVSAGLDKTVRVWGIESEEEPLGEGPGEGGLHDRMEEDEARDAIVGEEDTHEREQESDLEPEVMDDDAREDPEAAQVPI